MRTALRAVASRRWIGAGEIRDAVRESNGDLIPRPVVLHVHLPGRGRCGWCGVRWRVPPRDARRAWLALLRQLEEVSCWADPDRLCTAVELVMPAHPLPGAPRALRRLRRLLRALPAPKRGVKRRLPPDVLAIGPGARGHVGVLRWRNAAAAPAWLAAAAGGARWGRLSGPK